MRTNDYKIILKPPVRAASILLFAAIAAFGQQTINLTAAPASLTLPDGSAVPMWGYSCGAAVTGATATCRALNPSAPAATATAPAGWSPIVVTVPYVAAGTSLTINLANNLSFTPVGGTTANGVPTSLMIVGQLGAGLGTTATYTASPSHANAQANATWPI